MLRIVVLVFISFSIARCGHLIYFLNNNQAEKVSHEERFFNGWLFMFAVLVCVPALVSTNRYRLRLQFQSHG